MRVFTQSRFILLTAWLILILFSAGSFASSKGCCSFHKGVKECDKGSGKLRCMDNTLSPTCGCSGKTVPVAKSSKPTKTREKKAEAPKMIPEPTGSKRGRCSGHGGIKNWDGVKGAYICKDNTTSG